MGGGEEIDEEAKVGEEEVSMHGARPAPDLSRADALPAFVPCDRPPVRLRPISQMARSSHSRRLTPRDLLTLGLGLLSSLNTRFVEWLVRSIQVARLNWQRRRTSSVMTMSYLITRLSSCPLFLTFCT